MRRPSFYMVVLIKGPRMRWGFPIVIPLFVMEEVIGFVLGLLRAAMWVSPGLRTRIQGALPEGIPLDAIWELKDIFRELRSYGTWSFVDIADQDGVRILVKFL